MFKRLGILVLVLLFLSTGCVVGRRARLGGAVGAAAGAGVGLATTRSGLGALAGGLIGYAVGAGVGAVMDDKAGELEEPTYGPDGYPVGPWQPYMCPDRMQCYSQEDIACRRFKGYCDGVRRAVRDRANRGEQQAQSQGYCDAGGPGCVRMPVKPQQAQAREPRITEEPLEQ